MKLVLVCFLWIFAPFFSIVGEVLFRPFQGHNQVELVFVMVVLPGVLNVMYFWVADSYMKGGKGEVSCGLFSGCLMDGAKAAEKGTG